ncbi:hypothetical protein D3C78_1038600 [compost metagenome]
MGVACMSALLLAMLPQGGLSMTGDALLGSLQAGAPSAQMHEELLLTFRHLLLGSAMVSLLGLMAALALPDRQLRGR